MTRMVIPVLFVLYANGATNKFDAMTISEMLTKEECSGFSYSGIYKACTALFNEECVQLGLSSGNAYAYYLTKKGIEYYKESGIGE